jgi:uncharacterized protein (TIGR00369 family)
MNSINEENERYGLSPMLELLQLVIIDVGVGTATVTALPDRRFGNHMGRMHGGYVATIVDTVMGRAVMSRLPDATGFGTVDLSVKFVRRIDIDSGQLTASARVMHAGRTMFTAEAAVVDASGKLCAHGSGTFLVYPKQSS